MNLIDGNAPAVDSITVKIETIFEDGEIIRADFLMDPEHFNLRWKRPVVVVEDMNGKKEFIPQNQQQTLGFDGKILEASYGEGG